MTLGRLEDGEKQASLQQPPDRRPPTVDPPGARASNLSPINDELRKRYSLKDDLKGVVVTRVDPNSHAADKRIQAGRGHRRGRPGAGLEPGRRDQADRRPEDGGQEVGAAPGRRTPRAKSASSRCRSSRTPARAERRPDPRPVADELRRRIALAVQQRRQVGVVDPGMGGRRHGGLGVEGDAEAGAFEHREIVGAVADRQRVGGRRARGVRAARPASRASPPCRGSARDTCPRAPSPSRSSTLERCSSKADAAPRSAR